MSGRMAGQAVLVLCLLIATVTISQVQAPPLFFSRNITTLADENLLGFIFLSTLHIETTVAWLDLLIVNW